MYTVVSVVYAASNNGTNFHFQRSLLESNQCGDYWIDVLADTNKEY